jgi:hypothetical protein
MDQRFDGFFDIEFVEAGLTHRKVSADRVTAGGIDLVVEELIHPLQHLLAIVERCILRSIDVHALLASARFTPRSRA